jgi:hypothetical protein
MMPRYCWLDLLPVELLYTLFTYFLAHEILFTFSDVSDYINAILLTYSAYRLDFKSIRKSDFDLVCQYIRPEQVLSLTLSDDNDTPDQSELFFSRFSIEEFTQLQSLTLIKIEYKSIKSIFTNLHKLDRLHFLSFNDDTIRHRYPAWNDDYSNESNQLKAFLLNIYTRVLPQLTQVYLRRSADLTLTPLPCLRHLKLETCTKHELETIFQRAPQLTSLDICLNTNTLNPEYLSPSNQLIRLNLKIESIKSNIFICKNDLFFVIYRTVHFNE